MDEKTVNQETKQQPGAQTPPRSFTQAEVDAMIGERLSRERAKFADYEELKAKADQFTAQEEAAKSDPQKAQDKVGQLQSELDAMKKAAGARDARDKVSAATGVPAHLLTGDTEEACKAQADAMLKWRGAAQNYPAAKDAGEVQHATGGKTREQFEEWYNSVMNSKS